MVARNRLVVRWTVGNVSAQGFEALRLSLWGGLRVFGPEATYVVCVNSVPLDAAREAAGEVPDEVHWRAVTREEIPGFIRDRLDAGLAEGVGWKFAPLQLFPDRHELALDNDCVLWDMPAAIRTWLDGGDPRRCVIAEDVRRCVGRFAPLCGPEPRNSGIRGLPGGFDLEASLRRILAEHHHPLTSEQDEQGLQTLLVSRAGEPLVVRVEEVTICSPFPPHRQHLGRCGGHFVGLNARHLPWGLDGRPAVDHIREHWGRHREAIQDKVGVPALC